MRTSRGEEEVVGRVVEGGIKIKKNKREEKSEIERGEKKKNKERIYRRGGRALTNLKVEPRLNLANNNDYI